MHTHTRICKDRKVRILYTVFLCCYFFYVIFPVTYTVPSQGHSGSSVKTDGRQEQTRRTARLLLSDLLLSLHRDAADDEDAASPATGSGHILLIKKRAIASSFKNILAPPVVSAVVISPKLISEGPVLAAVADDDASVRPVKGFQLFHSGIAPPAV